MQVDMATHQELLSVDVRDRESISVFNPYGQPAQSDDSAPVDQSPRLEPHDTKSNNS